MSEGISCDEHAVNILIADDDEGDRERVIRALKRVGLVYEFTETTNIEDAIEACEHCAFDCAFVDYWLPGQDGLEGITVLHKRFPYMALIMSTGEGDELVAVEALRRGATDYIPKSHIDAVSIRRITENALEKVALQRKVAEQQAELECFANVLVHDLKAPIRSIQYFAGFMEEGIREGKPEKNIEDCRRIIKAAKRMGTLIDTLHQYTKAEEPVVFHPVEMDQVMKDALSNLEHFIRERRVHVTGDALPAVTGNGALLTQLLQNLIGNGVKYCEAEIPCIHVAASQKEGTAWQFSVKDNGIGIPEEYYRQVFVPFERLHPGDKYEGTGLGLATCNKIVKRHGGRIWCESDPGQGTTFFFTLLGTRSNGGDAQSISQE